MFFQIKANNEYLPIQLLNVFILDASVLATTEHFNIKTHKRLNKGQK